MMHEALGKDALYYIHSLFSSLTFWVSLAFCCSVPKFSTAV